MCWPPDPRSLAAQQGGAITIHPATVPEPARITTVRQPRGPAAGVEDGDEITVAGVLAGKTR